jgi:DNA-binding GntR family transcriptional regulator
MSTDIDAIGAEARTLRGQVLLAVRSALASGTLAPGVRINELGLSARLGVSRGTLREALRRLEQEGLLVTLPHRGTFVRDLSAEEVTQVYGVRFALESYAAQSAAARLTPDVLATLRARLDELAAAVDAEDFRQGVTADLRFHEAICEASGNRFLVDQWRSLVGLIAAVMHTAGPEFLRPLQSIEDHQRLLDSLESRDPGRIAETWRAHFDEGAETVAETVRRRHAAETKPAGEAGGSP